MQLETLLEQCRAGDELAWEALVRRYQGRVFALAYHYLRDREEAREVAQETFIRVYRGLRTFDGEGSFTAWLVRVARNCAIDRIRKLQSSPAYEGDEVEATDPLVATGPDPEDHSLAQDRRDLICRALDRMSEINREMILLKEIQGLKQREIADMLAIPLGTVKARTNRARLELAERILELEPSYGGVS
jgi:RNA polymerase sigma-70 factor (ECF subfamily)